jgi:uroporphyrinogen-III synthase
MISFSLVPDKIDFEGYDLLMFTSKQAVKSAEAIDPLWKRLPAVAIGSATQKEIEKLGGKVLYSSEEAYGEALSQAIIKQFSDKKILYLRPKEVSFDSKRFLLGAGITIHEQIIYETSCIRYASDQSPKKDAVIVFTSPSTIRCFFENFEWDESYRAVVIGAATQKHLPDKVECLVADEHSLEACIEKARIL